LSRNMWTIAVHTKMTKSETPRIQKPSGNTAKRTGFKKIKEYMMKIRNHLFDCGF